MLKNVGHTGRILGYGHERDAEGLVDVLVFYGQGLTAEHRVGEKKGGGMDFGDVFLLFKEKSVVSRADGKRGHDAPFSESFMGIQKNGDRAGICQGNLHHGLKNP